VRNIVNKTKASIKRFKALFKGIPIPTYLWQKIGDDLVLIDYNDAAEKITKGMIKNYVGIKVSEMYKNLPEILEEFYRCSNDHVSIFREMKYGYMSTGENKFLSVMYGFIPPDLVIVHTEDITEKKEVLRKLKESEKELKVLNLKLKQRIDVSEEKYKTIFENTGTATIIVEEDTTISLVNGQFEELSGYSREEIEWKKSWIEFVFEEDLERMKKLHYFRRKDPESTLRKYEFRFVNKEGNIRDILIIIDMIPKTKKSVASLLDITERKKAEEKLKESEEKYRDLFESSPISLWEEDFSELRNYIDILKNSGIEDFRVYFDKNPGEVKKCSSMVKIVDINKKTIELYKANNKEDFIVGLDKVFTEESLYTFKELIITFAKGKTRFESEAINCALNGEKLNIFIVCEIVAGFKEDWSKILVSIVDISERKKAELKLKNSEEKYKYLFDSAQVGLYWSKISDGNFLECNDTFAKLFGYDTREEFLTNYNAIKHYIDPNARSELLDEIRDNKEIKNYEIHVTKRDGTPIWVSISARMFESENRIEGAAIDITEHKIAEEKILESEEKYREAYNRAEFYKDLFAHDINNILQSILSGIQISQLILDNPEKRDNLIINAEIIKEQVIRGARLVSNVRKLSKLEEARRSLETIEILNFLKKSFSLLKKSYKDKNLAIRVDSIEEKFFIKANDLLEDVFENILINAIRHNQNLIIEITVRISREQNVGKYILKIEFMDNGIGVADSMKEKIFQRGYNKETGVYGMGLGLSLVRGIIESYNGKIWVEDRVKGDRSKGSNFVILIPEVD
jgi:PAS domain S-box-containing protein